MNKAARLALTAGLIIGGGSIEGGSSPINVSPDEPNPSEIVLPNHLLNEVMSKHEAAIRTHEQAIQPILENPNVPREVRYLLQNVRMDFVDITTGNELVSLPGEVHLMLVATNLNSQVREKVEILEAYDPASTAVEALSTLGFVVNLQEEPLDSDPMDDGIRGYYEVDLELGKLADALHLDLPDNIDPNVIIDHVAELVVEQPANQMPYIRDFLQGDLNHKVFFSAVDRMRQE